MIRLGLRARVTAGFAAGALALSTCMALASYQLIRSSLLTERDRSAVRAAQYNAAVVQTGLPADEPEFLDLLRSLDTGTTRRPFVFHNGEWFSRSADIRITDEIPAELQRLVARGQPAAQRIRAGGEPVVVVGIPLTERTAYYSVDSLQELDRTLQLLALALTLAAVMTAAGGASLGWYATRYVLRPLARVESAAQEIAAGDLTARLDPAAEPDLARLAVSFNHMVDQLSERMERDRRFAADVSHELRSPLQTLSAAASVLHRRRDRLDERSAAAAGLVADEVARFEELVDDLIELARGDQPTVRVEVDVAAAARAACRQRGLPESLVDAPAGTPAVWRVDRRRIEQTLGNLIDNAMRYGGGPTAVRLGADGVSYWLEVDDEGPGVSPDDREVIFERFVRGRVASARGRGGGTGLGLALVAQHAAAHGGRAFVTDRPGGGARFRVELPRSAS